LTKSFQYSPEHRIAKMIPNPPGKSITLKEAIESEPRLGQIAESEPLAQRLFEITGKIEGLYRHASTHPAGVVIGDRPLPEILPLYRDPRSDMPVTQFEMKAVEKAGLVKIQWTAARQKSAAGNIGRGRCCFRLGQSGGRQVGRRSCG
jgi:DNA polymerase-3 subunit alpha